MTTEELEVKYETELDTLRNLDKDTSALSAVLIVRNILATILGPIMQDHALKDKFMELFTIDLKLAGYTLTKDEEPEVESKDKNEAA